MSLKKILCGKISVLLLVAMMVPGFVLSGCGSGNASKPANAQNPDETHQQSTQAMDKTTDAKAGEAGANATMDKPDTQAGDKQEGADSKDSVKNNTKTDAKVSTGTIEKTSPKSASKTIKSSEMQGLPLKGKIICIDAGHQGKGDSGQEAIGPGASEKKPKVASGTQGVSTKIPEYKFTLAVALKLQKALEKKGATVIMTRTGNDVNISNAQRAQLANEAGADMTIRIHADGNDNHSAHGISMHYPGNKFVHDDSVLNKSRKAAEMVLDDVIRKTGAANKGVFERNDLTGFNWTKVPVILIESGFMTNSEEDKLMNTDAYQDKLAEGLAEGLEHYFTPVDIN